MAKKKSTGSQAAPAPKKNPVYLLIGAIAVIAIIATVVILVRQDKGVTNTAPRPAGTANANAPPPPATPPPSQPVTQPPDEVTTMEVAKAVMVTVEEDFGKNATFAEALRQIERRYTPADGVGRTFAILDAYGDTMPDGRLHMSMHISSEKPGEGQLIHKKTGKVLWRGKINSTSQPMPQKALRIIVEAAPGNSFNVDVNSADNVINAVASGKNSLVKDVWPDGETREVTFIFSACGCPVKAMVKRVGERTQRTTDTPVMFPDDPDALKTIARFMRW
jgi:hypothetical protein